MVMVSFRLMNLADFVKQRRQELGLSMRDLAKLAGVSHSYIGFIEAGVNPSTGRPVSLTIDALRGLAKGLNVPFEKLSAIASGSPIPSERELPLVTASEIEALRDRASVVKARQAAVSAEIEKGSNKADPGARKRLEKLLDECEAELEDIRKTLHSKIVEIGRLLSALEE